MSRENHRATREIVSRWLSMWWENATCSVVSIWCHRAGVKKLIIWVSGRYFFVLCAVICSGGWRSTKPLISQGCYSLDLHYRSPRGCSGFAQSLRSFAGSLTARRGALAKRGIIKESRGPEGRYSVLGVRPRESKLSTACSPKRNQHRFCDANSLIINVCGERGSGIILL